MLARHYIFARCILRIDTASPSRPAMTFYFLIRHSPVTIDGMYTPANNALTYHERQVYILLVSSLIELYFRLDACYVILSAPSA